MIQPLEMAHGKLENPRLGLLEITPLKSHRGGRALGVRTTNGMRNGVVDCNDFASFSDLQVP